MEEKVWAFIEENHLLESGDRVLVAFSGGADSLAMLHLLNNLAEHQGFTLGICHVHHGLRGAAADGDEAFARQTAKDLQRPFHSIRMDVKAIAKAQGLSLEDAGRRCRYAYFKKIMVQEGYDKCALAHNQNDQAETLLLHLFRGAGLLGLAAMDLRRGPFVRPILFLARKDIEAYLEKNGLEPRQDASNEENAFRRNRLRNEVVPYLKKHFQPELSKVLYKTARTLRRDLDYLEEEATRFLSMHSEESFEKDAPSVTLLPSAFALHEAMVRRVVFAALEKVKGDREDLEEIHVEAVIQLSKSGTGKQADIKGGVLAENEYGRIRIHRAKREPSEGMEQRVDIQDGVEVTVSGRRLRFQIFDMQDTQMEEGSFYLDAEVLGSPVLFRNRRPGDRMKPLGLGGHKKVKDILIDRKIPRKDRDRMLILEVQGQIALLDEIALGEAYRVTEHTKKVLQITFVREDMDD